MRPAATSWAAAGNPNAVPPCRPPVGDRRGRSRWDLGFRILDLVTSVLLAAVLIAGFSETILQRMLQEAGGKRAQNRSREKNRGVFEFAAGRDRTALARAKIQTQELYLNDQAASHESFAKKPPSTLDCVVSEDGTTEP